MLWAQAWKPGSHEPKLKHGPAPLVERAVQDSVVLALLPAFPCSQWVSLHSFSSNDLPISGVRDLLDQAAFSLCSLAPQLHLFVSPHHVVIILYCLVWRLKPVSRTVQSRIREESRPISFPVIITVFDLVASCREDRVLVTCGPDHSPRASNRFREARSWWDWLAL